MRRSNILAAVFTDLTTRVVMLSRTIVDPRFRFGVISLGNGVHSAYIRFMTPIYNYYTRSFAYGA